MNALSIRQPHAEAVFRRRKKIEYRTQPTNVRGRVYIYASLGRYPADVEAEFMEKYGIRNVPCDDLPRGVIVGTVEIVACAGRDRDYEWHLRRPERAKRLRKPTGKPQPVWFKPF